MKLQNRMILILNNVSTKIKHELALLSIEKYFLNKINYDNLIDNFAS